jgi:hypothetical protein
VLYCPTIAGTQSSKKHDEFLVLFLSLAQINKLLDDRRGNLGLQELSIVTQKLLNSAKCSYIIFFPSSHCLGKEEVDPLGGISFIDLIATYSTVQKAIGNLTYLSDVVILGDVSKDEALSCEGEIQDLDNELRQVKLSQDLLPLDNLFLQGLHVHLSRIFLPTTLLFLAFSESI